MGFCIISGLFWISRERLDSTLWHCATFFPFSCSGSTFTTIIVSIDVLRGSV